METQVETRQEAPFLKACRREETSYTPVWIMRQAGRYMKEYRMIRDKHAFKDMCKDKHLASEITLMAVEKVHPDAAIIFSDILLVVEPMGLRLTYEPGTGPQIFSEGGTDISSLREIEAEKNLQYVYEAIAITRKYLPEHVPLIGFCGAPFTLAAYILEGGGSRSFLATKRFMHAQPEQWHELMEKLVRGLVVYLNEQARSGADALQVFDSWVGCLNPHDYDVFVAPHMKNLFSQLTEDVPTIHFGTGTSTFLEQLRDTGGDVIGVDFRMNLDEAWNRIGHERGIQGNLDPAILLTNLDVIREHVKRILGQAANRPGHIFNLGHGVLPETPVDHVRELIQMVHELSAR